MNMIRIKHPFLLLSLFAVTAFAWMGFSFHPLLPDFEEEQVEYNSCAISNTTFEGGEELVYKIFYNMNFVWIPAGEVVFKVHDQGALYRITAHGKTYSSYEWFFTVDDKYECYVDKETLLPRVSIRDVHEGDYTVFDQMTFDQENYTIQSVRGPSRTDIRERNSYELDRCMHDILSLLYFARNLDFDSYSKGQKIAVELFMDGEAWPLNVEFLGRQNNKKIHGLGRFDAIQFRPETIAGEVFSEGTHMDIWVSADANKVPLLIESPVSVGSIKAVLKSYKGLRHEFSAKRK